MNVKSPGQTAASLSVSTRRVDSLCSERIAGEHSLPTDRFTYTPGAVMSAVVIALVLLGVLSATAWAQTCTDSSTCSEGLQCQDNRCVAPTSATPAPNATANDECGRDRRCRIDRLKRRNQARRQAAILSEEQALQRLIAAQEQQRVDEIPRLRSPFGFDFLVTAVEGFGLVAGYTFSGKLRAEAAYTVHSDGVYFYDPTNEYSLGGYQDIEVLSAHLLYFFGDSWFSPYVSAGFLYGFGNYTDYGYSDDGNFTYLSADVEYHALDIAGGVDLQIFSKLLKSSFHSRLGLAYRPLIYNQARMGPGIYDEVIKTGLKGWFQSDFNVDLVFLFGWAF